MISEELKNINSSNKELRKFGVLIMVILVIIGLVMLYKDKPYTTWYFSIAVLILIVSFLLPILLLPFQKIWMGFAVIMGWIMTRLILSVLFYVIFTLIRIVGGLFGKKFLDLKIDHNAQSYWIIKKAEEQEKTNLENQF